MPGYLTHYLFGKQAISSLKNEKPIKEHTNVFHLGTQGPDVFFYYFPGYITKAKGLGEMMHKTNVGEYFNCCLTYLATPLLKEKREVFVSYLAGFITHYTLDSMLHPYVYARTGYDANKGSSASYLSKHFQLETDIDCIMLERLEGKLPSETDSQKWIRLTKEERALLASSMSATISHTYYKDQKNPASSKRFIKHSIHSMPIGVSYLQHKHAYKRPVTELIESLFIKAPIISSLYSVDFVEDPGYTLNLALEPWGHPWDKCQISRSSFLDLFFEAEEIATERLEAFFAYYESLSVLSKNYNKKKQLKENLLKLLGSNSYNSGLPTI